MGDRAAQGDSRPKRRYSAAEVTVAEGTPVQVACHVVGISESDWYAVPARPPSARSVRHALLTDLITQIHRDSRGIHGGRRVHAELTLGHGIEVGHGQVELLMRRAGLQGLGGRPRGKRVKPENIATDLVERNFARPGPNQLWVTDITEQPTREGKIYCRVVLDTYSRRVVGSSIDNSPTAALATNSLGMAIDNRLGNRAGRDGDHDPLRAGRPIRFLGVHPTHQGVQPRALDGQRGRLSGAQTYLVLSLRQLHDRTAVVAHAGQAPEPS